VAIASVALIVARARNGVIGLNNRLPWHIPEELQHFKATTMGHMVLMGRKTFDSIGRALPGRTVLVLTRDTHWRGPAGVDAVPSLEAAIDCAGSGTLMVAGGAQIYTLATPAAQRIILTEVDLEPEGDTFMPAPDTAHWKLERSRPMQSKTGIGYVIQDWVRR
jgi:dihydrofolate reductase